MSPADAQPRRAIVAGLGRMGSVVLGEALATGLIHVVALVDVNRVAAEAAAARVPEDVPVFADLADAASAVGADCTLIATPSNRHAIDVRAGLDAGLDVFCEKPLTLDVDESRALGRLASDRGLRLQVGFWRRYAAPFRLLRAAAEEHLGQIIAVRAVQWDADPPPPGFYDPSVSGGLVVDCGIHEFDLAAWLGCPIGDPVVVRGLAVDPAIAAMGEVDNVTIVGRAEQGATVTVDLSLNCRYADDVRTEVLGTLGAAFLQMEPTWSVTTRLAGGVVHHRKQRDGEPGAFRAGVRAELAAFALGDDEAPGAETSAQALDRCLVATRLLKAHAVA